MASTWCAAPAGPGAVLNLLAIRKIALPSWRTPADFPRHQSLSSHHVYCTKPWRTWNVRAEKDPFAEYSAAFLDDEEQEVEEESSEGSFMTDAEKEAAIAFEMGGKQADKSVEDDSGSNDEEVGGNRTVEKERKPSPRRKQGKGAQIADFLTVFLGLLERPTAGNGKMIAAAGGAVTERVQEEVESLRGVEGVDEQILFEILRVVKLIEMDLQLVSASRKDQTLIERLKQAAVHTQQAMDIANAL